MADDSCIFCKIASKKISTDAVFEDDELFAFFDINPKAPVHILIIPKRHIEKVSDLRDDDVGLIGRMVMAARRIAKEKGIDVSGYRIVFNCNRDAGQDVLHVHLHLLGGRKFNWPPG